MDDNKILKMINNISKTIVEHEGELTELDRTIGDGDHGVNLKRGFTAILDKLEDINNDDEIDISKLLNDLAMTLLSTVGGASGPLYATAIMKMSAVFKDKDRQTININDINIAIGEALKGIKSRGKAELGDKTMIDTIEPFYNAFNKAVLENKDIKDSFSIALLAAKDGMNKTKEISAKRGRASYLGDRSIGVVDPGAYSSYLILKTIYDEI